MTSPGDDAEQPLRARWSPAVWDPGHTLGAVELGRLIDAARWSPSAGNAQPWSFLPALRGDETHRRLVPLLAASTRRWAPDASALVVNLCHRYVEGTDWDYSEFSEYDLGQAVAHMTVEGQRLDLYSRQFRGFDRDGLHRALGVPPHWVAMTITAFGRPPAGVEEAARSRRTSAEVLWSPTADGSGRG